jgi:hypothetical protein
MAPLPEPAAVRRGMRRSGLTVPRCGGMVLAAIAFYAIIMEAQTYPSRDAVSVLSDGKFTELYVALIDGQHHEMTTQQFFEKRPDLGEVEFLKRVNWEVPVAPPDALPFIATSGRLQADLDAFWVGWRAGNSVSALSIFQEEPIRATLADGDQLVSQPIIMPSKKLYYYFWHGAQLRRLEFTGEFGHPGSVAMVELSSEQSSPALSASRAVPGSTADESVIGLVEMRNDGAAPAVLFVSGKSVKRIAGEPVAGYVPLARQHAGLHVDTQGGVTIAFLAERRDNKAYALIECVCPRDKTTCQVTTKPLPEVTPGSMYSAAPIYYERTASRKLFVLVLDLDGKLSEVRGGSLRLIRSRVDRSYSFPILTTVGARYEARFAGKESLQLIPIE